MEDDHVADVQVTDRNPLSDDDVSGLETGSHAAGQHGGGMPAPGTGLIAAPGESANGEDEQ
jgi:hypothetical protein